MSAGAVIVHVPWPLPGGPLRWRVGVDGRWGAPGQPLAAPPGPTVVTLVLEVVTAGLWLLATTRFQVAVAPGGTTLVALPGSTGRAR
jgi:hypothetical protein